MLNSVKQLLRWLNNQRVYFVLYVRLFIRIWKKHPLSLLRSILKSKSQIGQDIFVLSELGFKKGGYFVEFGATDGVHLSNTYLLEKVFNWTGILAEPAKIWHHDLKKNRSCSIETDCVWSNSNDTLNFKEVERSELSTLSIYGAGDQHSTARKDGKMYEVRTITLTDMLEKYHAPKVIDYLSIDTEGSEYEILNSFDFDKYRFRVITCEHNYTPTRNKIYQLLKSKGYERKYEDISSFDDWYINKTL